MVDEIEAQPARPLDVVQRSGRQLAVGSDWWEIRDPGVPVQFVDILTEGRHMNGVVHLAFASAIVDANNAGIASIAARLRMDLSAAQHLRNMLNGIIEDALKPKDQSKTN